MSHQIHYPILEKIGLSHGEALIFELLLEKGRSKASDLVEPSGLGRGNTYNYLNALREKGLVQAIEGKQSAYEVVDPSGLEALLEAEKLKTSRLEEEFRTDLKRLQSVFQLSTGRPTIALYEGMPGLEKAIFDTLLSKTEILTYLDIEAIQGPIVEINKRYLKKRISLQIQKRLIVADTEKSRAFFEHQNTPFTSVAFVKDFPSSFETAMEIYDGTVSYLTMRPEKNIAVIMHDPSIYEMHRKQFEYVWKQASQIKTYAASAHEVTDGTSGSNAT